MEKRVISFLSSQGRGFSVDLALTKNYLQSFFHRMRFSTVIMLTMKKVKIPWQMKVLSVPERSSAVI